MKAMMCAVFAAILCFCLLRNSYLVDPFLPIYSGKKREILEHHYCSQV